MNNRHLPLTAAIMLLAALLAVVVFAALADDGERFSPPELPTLTPPSITAEPYPPPYPAPYPPPAFLPFAAGESYP